MPARHGSRASRARWLSAAPAAGRLAANGAPSTSRRAWTTRLTAAARSVRGCRDGHDRTALCRAAPTPHAGSARRSAVGLPASGRATSRATKSARSRWPPGNAQPGDSRRRNPVAAARRPRRERSGCRRRQATAEHPGWRASVRRCSLLRHGKPRGRAWQSQAPWAWRRSRAASVPWCDARAAAAPCLREAGRKSRAAPLHPGAWHSIFRVEPTPTAIITYEFGVAAEVWS